MKSTDFGIGLKDMGAEVEEMTWMVVEVDQTDLAAEEGHRIY